MANKEYEAERQDSQVAGADMRTGDPIPRAYANLKAVRDNLPDRNVFQSGLYTMFNNALDELQQAGVEVREWRLPSNAVGNTNAKEFAARIDAILMYFVFQNEKTAIGFRI
jgi:hypothetical protein